MTVGTHIIADFYGVDSAILARADSMAVIFEEAVEHANATKLASSYYQFQPFGASGVILLAESHMSFHTWPEYGVVTLDLFTCGGRHMVDRAYEYIENALKPKRVEQHRIQRGNSIQEGDVSPKPIVGPVDVGAPGSEVTGPPTL